jgi:RNA polymerase sigma-70 factor (ECF subfamily)
VTRPHLVFVDELPEQDDDVEGGEPIQAVIDRDMASRAMESLSDSERSLLLLAYFRGMTAREIAEADGIPLGTVKTRLRTALIKLRRVESLKEQP